MHKPTVAVIFGSRSAEHDVSIITALSAVIKPLELTKQFNVVPVYIAKNGAWYSHDSLKKIATFQSNIDAHLAKLKPVQIDLNNGFGLVFPGLKAKQQKIDIVFPATHGTFGEDGALMGLLEMANVPYVGCDLSSSVVSMDKVLAKLIVAAQNIQTPKMAFISSGEFAADPKAFVARVSSQLKYPVFVKPAHLGSSIGITRVASESELLNAVEVAAHYDNKILVEEAVENLVEVTVPILGNHELTTAQPEEPIQGDDFFDFETKYLRQGKGKVAGKATSEQGAQGYSHLPARISDELQQKCLDTAQAVYKALGCVGTARVDLLLDSKTGVVYFNEVNPLPGSLYAHNWRSVGISNVALVEQLVALALARHEERQRVATVFTTNFLQQF
jgi:D-alanine-D-alanine ligase